MFKERHKNYPKVIPTYITTSKGKETKLVDTIQDP